MVKDFIVNGSWNQTKLMRYLPQNLISAILNIDFNSDRSDTPIWIPDQLGIYTCKSAWQLLRLKKGVTVSSMNMWHNKIPFRILFFMMRVLIDRIGTDIAVKRFVVNLSSKCNCCSNYCE